MVKMFVYGSLKKGFYNFKCSGLDKEQFIGEGKIMNAKMYSLGLYPAVVESYECVVHGEVYGIDTLQTIQRIIHTELGVGYYMDFKKIEMKDGTKEIALVFLQHFNPDRHTKLIEDGVWKKKGDY